MMKHIILSILLAGGLVNCANQSRDAMQLHKSALVVDLHSDTVLRMKNDFDFSKRDTTGHMDIPRLIEGGIDLQVFACWLPTQAPIDSCVSIVDNLIDLLDKAVADNSGKMAYCKTAGEAESVIGSGKIAAFIGIENGVAIANNLDHLQHFYDRGVRYMTLTHTASNDWCISSGDDEPAFDGLTKFGESVVAKMNELGMIVDISHAHTSTVDKVLAITTAPVIASHSCVHALCDHDRNLTDEQIKAIADNGGVIGINFYNGYLSDKWNEAADSLWDAHRAEIDSIKALYDDDEAQWEAMKPILAEVNEELGSVGVDVGTVCNHIDYIVKLVGADYVGLGSDFDGVFALPEGLTDCSMIPNITVELVKRGYADEDIKKILGGNFMRVFKKVCG